MSPSNIACKTRTRASQPVISAANALHLFSASATVQARNHPLQSFNTATGPKTTFFQKSTPSQEPHTSFKPRVHSLLHSSDPLSCCSVSMPIVCPTLRSQRCVWQSHQFFNLRHLPFTPPFSIPVTASRCFPPSRAFPLIQRAPPCVRAATIHSLCPAPSNSFSSFCCDTVSVRSASRTHRRVPNNPMIVMPPLVWCPISDFVFRWAQPRMRRGRGVPSHTPSTSDFSTTKCSSIT